MYYHLIIFLLRFFLININVSRKPYDIRLFRNSFLKFLLGVENSEQCATENIFRVNDANKIMNSFSSSHVLHGNFHLVVSR